MMNANQKMLKSREEAVSEVRKMDDGLAEIWGQLHDWVQAAEQDSCELFVAAVTESEVEGCCADVVSLSHVTLATAGRLAVSICEELPGLTRVQVLAQLIESMPGEAAAAFALVAQKHADCRPAGPGDQVH